jgi:ATP-binding cassette subfamily B protein
VRAQLLLGTVTTLLYAASFQLVPLGVREIVVRIERGEDSRAIASAAWGLIGAAMLVALFRFASRVSIFRAGREVEYRLRNDFLAHLQRLPQSFFDRHRTGDLMSRAVNDIQSVRMFIGMGALNLVQTPALYALAIGVMTMLDWRLTLFVIAPYPLFIAIGRVFGRRIHHANLTMQQQLGRVSTVAQENAAGVFVVRSYGMEPAERERFAVENRELYRRHIRLALVDAGMQPTVGMLPALAQVLVLYVGGQRVAAGQLSAGDLWAFYTYIFMLAMPTYMMGWVIAILQRGLAGLERLGEVLDLLPAIRDHEPLASLPRIRGEVELRALSFAYPDQAREQALSSVDLRVAPGETVGIVGPVGSGKSTLVSLIPRLLEAPEGSLFLDGVEVSRIPLSQLRSSIAMVPQDSFLFSTTIAENVRFGAPDAPPHEVREAAGRAHVLEDIEDFPDGFETVIGERGVTLSGGQRQRVALARALLLDPAILILDDALSSVDAATEEAILKELRGARAGRTCFIVAHRLSALRDADQILVLDESGRVAEHGAHESLLAAGGFYARIHRQQQLQAELELEEEVA